PIEAEQTCKNRGGHLCTTADWQTACFTNPPNSTTCTWGYSPHTPAGCGTKAAYPPGTRYCNLGGYDFSSTLTGDQDGLLVTGSTALQNCYADWSGLLGNTATTNKIFDITGNLREITKQAANVYPLMGGSFDTADENGATCTFEFYTVDQNFQLYDL